MSRKVLILESEKDQAKSIAYFLKKSKQYQINFSKDYKIDDLNGYDYVIPTGANSTFYYVNKFGDFYIGRVKYAKSNLITFDKIKTLNIVKQIGVPIPITYTNKEEINFFPIFYKSLREEGYAERGIIRDRKELDEFNNPNVFFQEFIWSKGTYSVGFLADRGKIITYFIQKEILSYPYHGGSGVILEQIDDNRLLTYTKEILRAVNYTGWGLTEFKFCNKRKDYIFMEVNGKFWASLKFAFLNNPIFLKYLFDIDIKPKNIKTVVYLDRVLKSDLPEILFSIPYLFKSKILISQPISKVLKEKFIKKQVVKPALKMMPQTF